MLSVKSIIDFYRDGFRSMTVGRSLWLLIIIKVAIIFGVLKVFFFPDILSGKTSPGHDEGAVVRSEIMARGHSTAVTDIPHQ